LPISSNQQELEIINKPQLPKLAPPNLFNHQINNNNLVGNDSSDDEVKDYLTIREPNYDEISHV
jgi:hypothetical protein